MVIPANNCVATLLVSCPDQRGIVAALAQVLYGHGANILDADQHTDPVEEHFFQRIRFDLTNLHTDRVSLERGINEVGEKFRMDVRLSYAEKRKRVAVFVSKYDHCLHDLLWRQRAGELDCDIPLVISNHPDLEDLSRQFGADFKVFPITKETTAPIFSTRINTPTPSKSTSFSGARAGEEGSGAAARERHCPRRDGALHADPER